jgi:hypothetical protein
MWCTSPNERARMAATFWGRPCSNIGVRGGTTTTIRHASTILCWTWKKQKPWCLALLIHAKSLCLKVTLLKGWRPSMTHSQLLAGLKCESKWKTTEEGGVGMRSLAHNTLRGRGACWSSRMGLGRIDKLIHSHEPAHNPHKVVNA